MLPPFIFFLLQFPPLSLVSATYNLPNRYFVNCGSASTVSNINGRDFVGDENPVNSLSVPSSGRTGTVENSDPSAANDLYHSARVFTEPSSYEFGIDDGDRGSIHVVRFHFFYFSSLGNSSAVRFHVSASGTQLLSNFTVGFRNFTHFPPIEEFLVRIPSDKLKIEFAPSGKGFIAFVNAIEVFVAPHELILDTTFGISNVVTPKGKMDYRALQNNPVLHVIHRINVGGLNIMPDNDTLLRYWIPDDNLGFMINGNAALKSEVHTGKLNYYSGGATNCNAPDNVYRTAKQMNITGNGRSNDFNISWHFGVRRGAQYLVRVHFCDVISRTPNEFLSFNMYIYGMFSHEIWPFHGRSLASPFYMDYVVRSDDSGFMNISIGPSAQSQDQTSAFLNGVEIMELIGNLRSSGSNSTRRRMLIIVVSSAGGSTLVLSLFIFMAFLVLRKKKSESEEASHRPFIQFKGGSWYGRSTLGTISDSPFADLNLGLRIPLAEIHRATNQFDDKCMIGEGGFGKVYKGMLVNGVKVAVKRSEPGYGQGISEFQTEIVILSKICHRHLVSLIGYCNEWDEMILVYEFMENGTLRDRLYTSGNKSNEPTPQSELSWEERLRICIGTAKGLHYLHTGPNGVFIHRDIKSTNILLDKHFMAKVADFGLSCSHPDDESHLITQVKGSFGYLDPEYFKLLQLTQKSDVYSFGVVLLEVLCARPAVDRSLPEEQVNLASWGLSWIEKDQLERIIDPLLVGKIHPNCLSRFGKTVNRCLQECGADRPDMKDVLWDLEYCLQRHVFADAYEDSCTTDIAIGLPIPHLLSDKTGDGVGQESSMFSAGHSSSQLKLGDC